MRPPEVYGAIAKVAAAMAQSGVPKAHHNGDSDYWYRSIDDVMERLAPLLPANGLCVLPRVLERRSDALNALGGVVLTHVTLKVAFDLVSVLDGSRHTVKAFGEALDDSDKATAKAMTSAFKGAMLQSFCIPVAGQEDGDSASPRASAKHDPAPVQGWEQWAQDVIDLMRGCESRQALDRVQQTHRAMLKAVSRERSDLYQLIGRELCLREDKLPTAPTRTRRSASKQTAPKSGNSLPVRPQKKSGSAHD